MPSIPPKVTQAVKASRERITGFYNPLEGGPLLANVPGTPSAPLKKKKKLVKLSAQEEEDIALE